MSYDRATVLVVTTLIPQRELRNNNADILNRVEAGESFVVTRNGVAVADVVPHMQRSGPPMFAKTKDLAVQRRAANGPALDSTAWLRDIRNADGVIDDDPLNSRA
jgi:prevent-host-death family protein